MFIHNFKYSFKTLFKNKSLIFWTFAFPLILGTLFSLAFSDIENSEKLHTIPIAIIEDSIPEDKDYLLQMLEEISVSDEEEKLFSIELSSREKAEKLLDKKEVKAYIDFSNNKTEIVVKDSSIEETITRQVLSEFQKNETIIKNLIEKKMQSGELSPNDFDKTYDSITKRIEKDVYDGIEDITRSNISYTMIEYYTLIAMACLYGSTLGLVAVNKSLANMSNLGKRIGVSPTKKSIVIFSSALASYLISLIGLLLLFAYTTIVLKIDYGSNIFLITLLACVGALAGLSMGIAVAALMKSNENTKTGILISLTMFGCFLSGMMGITMKYIIDKNIPILNKINPANMITDGFYALYYYDTFDRYVLNLISLLLFTIAMLLISINSLRRQRYDSI